MSSEISSLSELVACPKCDALHRVRGLSGNERASCARCGTLLIEPRDTSFLHVIALSLTAIILMVGAVFFPFLQISAQGLSHGSSIFGVAMAFSDGFLAPLALAVLLMIVALPLIRFCALIYVLWPLSKGAPPWPGAGRVFHAVEVMSPWMMAEVFIIGVAVALVKVMGLASVSFGPAFWAFCLLVLIMGLKNAFMSKGAIWRALGQ